jgi:hypothetical protein
MAASLASEGYQRKIRLISHASGIAASITTTMNATIRRVRTRLPPFCRAIRRSTTSLSTVPATA